MAEPTITQDSQSKLLPLCKVEDLTVQRQMRDMSDDDKAWCETHIRLFSRLAENYTGRLFKLMERTRDFTTTDLQRLIRLRAFGHPDSSIGSVWQSLSNVYDATTLVAAADYSFDWEENGLLAKRYGHWLCGVNAVRVKWTGGIAADVQQVPEDLRGVAIDQIASWYQRRDQLNIASMTIGGESTTRFTEHDLLPLAKRVLDDYRVVAL